MRYESHLGSNTLFYGFIYGSRKTLNMRSQQVKYLHSNSVSTEVNKRPKRPLIEKHTQYTDLCYYQVYFNFSEPSKLF